VSHGELIAVVGRYGSGKTSLIQALLGEMRDAGGSKVALNGRIAYSAQKPWILNETIRENILFSTPYEPKRYTAALHFSCLHDDLKMLSDGDQTLIGERGCTLSGGQKARVALARALYADADIILLDDILSAVDAHVGAFLFN
jgi:ATP-binding cassette, subfamily C (CFTR/MRP), member 1